MNYGIKENISEVSTLRHGDGISWGSLSSARRSTTRVREKKPVYVVKFMENDSDVPLHRLRCLRGLQRLGALKIGSAVNNPKYHWNVDNYKAQGQRKHTAAKQVPPFLQRSKTLQEIQNKPFLRFYSQPSITISEIPKPKEEPLKIPFSYSKRFSIVGLDDKAPLTRLPTNLERPLWRRPTTSQTAPLKEENTLFQDFAKKLELKPKNFTTSTEQDIFYNKYYPLLLDTHPEEDVMQSLRKRTPTPDIEWTPEMKRGNSITLKIQNLENLIDQLEEETEDVEFRTELRHEVFNPAKWEWNYGHPSYRVPTPKSLSMASSRARSPTSAGPTLPRRFSLSPDGPVSPTSNRNTSPLASH